MEFHLDRKVAFAQVEDTTLYNSCLKEFDDSGDQIGPDFIPWNYSLYFTAREVRFQDELNIERSHRHETTELLTSVEHKQRIIVSLKPGFPNESWHRRTTYSMFGTGRTISNFRLIIEALSGDEKPEHCVAWGTPSYTTEIDFRREKTDDQVDFHLYVKPETFARYSSFVDASAVESIVFCVGFVSGFYAEWSPLISTNEIKVLTSDPEHKVDGLEDCVYPIRRLGDVGKAKLYVHRSHDLGNPNEGENGARSDAHLSEEVTARQSQAELHHSEGRSPTPTLDSIITEKLAGINAQIVSLLSSLRTAGWVIVALLIFILVSL